MATPAAEDPSINGRPVLPDADAAKAADITLLETTMAELRGFHFGGPAADRPPPENFLPALFFPFREPNRVRTDYPLFIDCQADEDDGLCRPLSEVLTTTLDAIIPDPDQARILRENLGPVERRVHHLLGERPGLADAKPLLVTAAKALQKDLDLGGENAERLQQDLDALLAALPAGQLIGYSEQASIYLMLAAARRRLLARREAHDRRITDLRTRLQSLLDVEHSKDADSRAPQALGEGMGPTAADLVDPKELARMVGSQRGSVAMAASRRQRIENTQKTLETYLSRVPGPLLTVFCDSQTPLSDLEDPDCRVIPDADPVGAAAGHFDSEASTFVDLFRAVRTAELEVAGAYDEARHDAWFAELTWEAFSREELLLLPPIVALPSANDLITKGMWDLSQLLLSGRPVQVLVILDPAQNPGTARASGARNAPFADFRLELGYLGIGHRQALVQQSTTARPKHLVKGFLSALDVTRAALQVVGSGGSAAGAEADVGSWLHGGASVESRAHPLFRYNPELGESWARRLDFVGNPGPEEDWPVHELSYSGKDGEEQTLALAFTFADFVLLDATHREHFRQVPTDCSSEDLVQLADYLDLEAEEATRRVPFVWAVDAGGRLCRLVVTRHLVQACRDRLSFWHTLQELAGVRNQHVLEAIERIRAEAESKAQAEAEQLAASHAEELTRLRDEAVGEAMQGLAQMLLDTDVGSLADMPLPSAPAQAPTAPAEEATAEEAPAAEAPAEEAPAEAAEEAVSFDEPWIETVLCTSCNDCTAINAKVFLYDENKQAYIGDATAGTYAQIVQAAEKCPAKCIHPGMPLDKSEADLEELVQRADRFN